MAVSCKSSRDFSSISKKTNFFFRDRRGAMGALLTQTAWWELTLHLCCMAYTRNSLTERVRARCLTGTNRAIGLKELPVG